MKRAEPLLGLQLALASVVKVDLKRADAAACLEAALGESYPFLDVFVALCASGHFGKVLEPVTLRSAIKALKPSSARDLAIGVGVTRAFCAAWSTLHQPASSWPSAIERALIAEFLTYEHCPTLAEKAFVATLLANVGPDLTALLTVLDPSGRCASEELTRASLQHWCVPSDLSDCVPLGPESDSKSASANSVQSIVILASRLWSSDAKVRPEIRLQPDFDASAVADVLNEARRLAGRMVAILTGLRDVSDGLACRCALLRS